MYINTGAETWRTPTLHGAVSGMLGVDVDSKKILNDFFNQIHRQPKSFQKLLLTVALHPKPEDSLIWEKQTFTFGKETRYLVDEILMSGLSTAVILTVLKRYSDAGFSRQIKDEADLQLKMIIAIQNLPKVVLQPFLFDPLLLPALGGSLPYNELSKLARHFAQHMLPRDLAQQIMKSDASEAHLAYLGSYLRRHAEALQKKDPRFKRQVEIARKWRREQEQRRKQSRAGLGQSEQQPQVTPHGDMVGPWLCQGRTSGGIIRPDEGGRVIGLKVIFRRAFEGFRREVQRAVERVVTAPRVVSKFMTANENRLKVHHKQMLVEKVPDNAPVRLFGTFFYEATGCIWSVVQLTFPPERTRWERISPNIPPSKLLRLIRPFPWR